MFVSLGPPAVGITMLFFLVDAEAGAGTGVVEPFVLLPGAFRFLEVGGAEAPASTLTAKLDMPGMGSFVVVGEGADFVEDEPLAALPDLRPWPVDAVS
jgi:hypothetical protein